MPEIELRDYLAGKCVGEILRVMSDSEPLRTWAATLGLDVESGAARVAYQVADAMLKERERKSDA